MSLSLGVLVSGTGTNLAAIVEAIAERRLDATIQVVISNKPGALALDRARKAGVPAVTISHREYASREEFDAAVVAELRARGVDWVVLAGFMRVLSPVVLSAFPNRIVNVHPALLPAFPGVDGQGQAIEYGVKVAGCTVHLVDLGTDTGPILLQRAVPVMDDDDRSSLGARILVEEHSVLVEALQAIAEDRLEVIESPGRRTRTRIRAR